MAIRTLGTVKYIDSKERVLWNNNIEHEDLRISTTRNNLHILYLEQHIIEEYLLARWTRAWEQTVKAMLFDQHFGRSKY